MTFWWSNDNYGQLLQCYALQKYLRDLGHEAFLIRYRDMSKPQSEPLYQKIVKAFNPIKLYKFVRSKIIVKYVKNNINRNFDSFRNEYIISTPIIYQSIDELRNCFPKADLYITGSDQVWHDSLLNANTAAYFLDFGKDATKRISYAASAGRKYELAERNIFVNYLKKFSAVSVRENSLKDLCLESGINACVSIDPTLLLKVELYKAIEKPLQVPQKYAFIYYLNVEKSSEIYLKSILEYLNEKKLILKSVSASGYIPARELIKTSKNIYATIPEWLYLIDNAECVFTTSFHGTVFAILYHKPFLTIPLNNCHKDGNVRFQTLLTSLGLENRIFNPNISVSKQMNQQIDWKEVDRRLYELRQSSLDFLKRNLK